MSFGKLLNTFFTFHAIAILVGFPLFFLGLVFHLAGDWTRLPQIVAGSALVLSVVALLAKMSFLGTPRIWMNKMLSAWARRTDWQDRLFPRPWSHDILLFAWVVALPVIANSPAIVGGVWRFLRKGFAENAWVGTVVTFILLLIVLLILALYVLLILDVVTHKKLVIAEKGNTGNLFLMLSAILFGVSLGMSLFEKGATFSWWWWAGMLAMSLKFAQRCFQVVALLMMDGELRQAHDEFVASRVQDSPLAWPWAVFFGGCGVVCYWWFSSQHVFEATAMTFLVLTWGTRLLMMYPFPTTAAPAAQTKEMGQRHPAA